MVICTAKVFKQKVNPINLLFPLFASLFLLTPFEKCVIYAHHTRDSGSWRQVEWAITVGKLDWNATDTVSWHHLHIRNHSIRTVIVEWDWIHRVVTGPNYTIRRTATADDTVELEPRNGNVIDDVFEDGWLNADISNLDEGWYQIAAFVEINMKQRDFPANKTTRSVSSWSEEFFVD